MDDREFVLGALAVMLTSNSYENYTKDGREEFLDNAMKKLMFYLIRKLKHLKINLEIL
jgi:hypothetical protein